VVVVVAVIAVLDCAEKLALLCPAGTVKVEGTGKAVLFSERLMVAPPDGAGPLSVMVTVADCPAATVPGLIESEVNVTCAATITVMLAVWLDPL
jgi:hypothetical protein